jgi:hypothetical protein
MGETIVTVRPLGLTVWPQKSGSMRADAFWNPSTARHQIFLLVEVGDSFDNPLPIEGGKIGSSSNSWSELARVTLYSDLGPGHPAIISGWCFRDPGKLGELSLLELGITDVKSWELVEEP